MFDHEIFEEERLNERGRKLKREKADKLARQTGSESPPKSQEFRTGILTFLFEIEFYYYSNFNSSFLFAIKIYDQYVFCSYLLSLRSFIIFFCIFIFLLCYVIIISHSF